MPVLQGSSTQVNFDNLPQELETVISNDPIIINESVMDGFAKIREDFTVEQTDDKIPIVSMETIDANQPAKDEFNPTPDAVKVKAKLPKFFDIDIDLHLKRSDVISIHRTYMRWVMAKGRTKEDLIQNPWDLFFAKDILQRSGRGLALKGVYHGVYNETGFGSMSVIDGLIKQFTAGSGTNGDIPSANIYQADILDDLDNTNTYHEVQEICQLTEHNPELAGDTLRLRLSPESYRKYNQNRRTLFPEFVGPDARENHPDDFPLIEFHPDPAMTGSELMYITDKTGNLFFFTNEDLGNYNIKMIEDVKSWKLNIHYSACVEYGLGKRIFKNNRV